MKLLFQGGWKQGRNVPEAREQVEGYCRSFAEHLVRSGHTVVLTSARLCDGLVANEVKRVVDAHGKNIKDHLIFMLPSRENVIPREGRVIRLPETSWWIEERTYFVRNTDAVVAIGGGRGTFDCVEKAFLSQKPVFVARAIPCKAASAWSSRAAGYKYLVDGDSEPFDDLNLTADEFFAHVFEVVNRLSEVVYPRRVFIVHGHNHHLRDVLADLLRKLGFEAIVLQEEANRSLTIIEKLERETRKIGFAMVLYTPDDLGRSVGGVEQPRSRQNVLFEHGLLIGLIGRERTCAIVQGDLEIPSDLQGMLYERVTDLRDEALKVARILKQAGYKVDASTLV